MASGDKQPHKSMIGKQPESLKAKTLRSEKESATKLGGRAQPRSGASAAHKGDIKLDDFLIDQKQTTGSSILVHGKDLTKITREAGGEGKTPALLLKLESIPKTVAGEWIVLPLEKFAELFQ